MKSSTKEVWRWQNLEVAWNIQDCNVKSPISTVLIHGFGACKEHWRNNQSAIAKVDEIKYTLTFHQLVQTYIKLSTIRIFSMHISSNRLKSKCQN